MFTTKYMKNQPKQRVKRVGRYEDGGEVQKIELKKTPSGAMQYVRGDTSQERRSTAIKAAVAGSERSLKAIKDYGKNPDGKIDDYLSKSKGASMLSRAYHDEDEVRDD